MTTYRLKHIDCPVCAAKLEEALRKTRGVKSASVDFSTMSMQVDAENLEDVEKTLKATEPNIELEIIIGSPGSEAKELRKNSDWKSEIPPLAASFLLLAFIIIAQKALQARNLSVVSVVLSGIAYFLAGKEVVLQAARNIVRGKAFDELFLMSIASVGAFIIGAYEEAVGVMIFYKIGELLQAYAVRKSHRSIQALLALRPDKARVLRDGKWTIVSPDACRIGETVLVNPGEKIPVDGAIIKGYGELDTSLITGEASPRPAGPGDKASSGFISIDGSFEIEVKELASESSVAKIANLVEAAKRAKAPTERFIARFARWYTPAVVLVAILIAVIPPFFTVGHDFSQWFYRALVILVISCPCAFVVSVPLGYFGGLGGAARRGIIIKGSDVLDALAEVDVVVFDKTGTLSDGRFKVRDIVPDNGNSERAVLRAAAAAEALSKHPVANAVQSEWHTRFKDALPEIVELNEIPGHGISATLSDGTSVLAGHDRILHMKDIAHRICDVEGTVVHVAINGGYAGYILVGDEAKHDAALTISLLRNLGVSRIAMLTGDGKKSADALAIETGIKEVHANLLPHQKLEILESIIAEKSHKKSKGSVVFVGDGTNDAPVIARADAGIAMGNLGSDAAVETADAVIVTDEPSRLVEAFVRARHTRTIVIQNIAFALGAKLFFLALGALGIATMWEAVIADVGVTLIAIFNSMRALR